MNFFAKYEYLLLRYMFGTIVLLDAAFARKRFKNIVSFR